MLPVYDIDHIYDERNNEITIFLDIKDLFPLYKL